MYPLVPIVIVLAPHPSHVKLWVISMRTLFSSTYTALWGFTLGKDSSLLKRMPIGRVDTLCDPYLSSRSNTFIFKSSEMYPTNLLIFLFCERPIQWNEHVKLCLSSLGVLCTYHALFSHSDMITHRINMTLYWWLRLLHSYWPEEVLAPYTILVSPLVAIPSRFSNLQFIHK